MVYLSLFFLSDGPACFADCLDVDFCLESECYADCNSCMHSFVEDVVCGSLSYSYACGGGFISYGFSSYSFGKKVWLS